MLLTGEQQETCAANSSLKGGLHERRNADVVAGVDRQTRAQNQQAHHISVTSFIYTETQSLPSFSNIPVLINQSWHHARLMLISIPS